VPSGERALPAAVEEALLRQRHDTLPYWDAYGPVVPLRGEDLVITVADQAVAIPHGLGEIPDGMHVVKADGPLFAAPGVAWTKELAWVQTGSLSFLPGQTVVRARLIFFTCRGDRG